MNQVIRVPFNLSFHFDDRLRDVPDEPEAVRLALSWLRSQLTQTNDTHQQVQILGLIGAHARQLMELYAAQAALQRAIDLSNKIGDLRLKTANTIRLAHVYQWQENFKKSERYYNAVIDSCQSKAEIASYLDFAYQHAGKCKFDQKQYAAAQTYFQKALLIRLRKDERDLINSTRQAIERTRHCLFEAATE